MLLGVVIRLTKAVWSEVAMAVITTLCCDPDPAAEHQLLQVGVGAIPAPAALCCFSAGSPDSRKTERQLPHFQLPLGTFVEHPRPWCRDFSCYDHREMVNFYERSAWAGSLPVMKGMCSAICFQPPPRSSTALQIGVSLMEMPSQNVVGAESLFSSPMEAGLQYLGEYLSRHPWIN